MHVLFLYGAWFGRTRRRSVRLAENLQRLPIAAARISGDDPTFRELP